MMCSPLCAKAGLPASRLWLELTESVFMSPSDAVIETMRDLEMLGDVVGA